MDKRISGVVNDAFTDALSTPTERNYGPEVAKVSTDGGWLLAAKERHEKIMVEMNAERAENDYQDALNNAQQFSAKLSKIFGLNLEVEPGTTTVVIDGLHFTNGPRYSLRYWAACARCGEPAIDFEIFNSGDLTYALENEDGVTRTCETCQRQSWVGRTVTAATPEPTPLERLGSALMAYIQSIRTEE